MFKKFHRWLEKPDVSSRWGRKIPLTELPETDPVIQFWGYVLFYSVWVLLAIILK